MIAFSKLRPAVGLLQQTVLRRAMSDHRTLPITPSRWQWNKFKDLFHFYVLLGVIPCTLMIIGANIFVGPATLTEIPEDYVPKHWEYYRSPVTRFIARYITTDPQQDYEKWLAQIFISKEKEQMRRVEDLVKQKIAERNDYQAYYYRPVMAKYYRITKEASDKLADIRGD